MNFRTTATSTLAALACFVVLYAALLQPQQVGSLFGSAPRLLYLEGRGESAGQQYQPTGSLQTSGGMPVLGFKT